MIRRHRRTERFTSFRDKNEEMEKKQKEMNEKYKNKLKVKKYENQGTEIDFLWDRNEFIENWNKTVEDLADGRFLSGDEVLAKIKIDLDTIKKR